MNTGEEEAETVVFEFLENGRMNIIKSHSSIEFLAFDTWKKNENIIRIYETDRENGYHEFKKDGNKIVFIKSFVADGDGGWEEVYAGEMTDWGKYFTLTLYK
jgi:hypothetical protein